MSRFAVALLIGLAPLAIANDGWVGVSGSPKLMKGHPTIRMVSERITAVIYSREAHVECNFVFKNEGAATTVRIGFPDGEGIEDPNEEPISTFKSFRSYVDGRRTKTQLLESDGPGWPSTFQVKSVSFAKGQTRRIRNAYRISLSDLPLSAGPNQPAIRAFDYILSTGSSWKGSIGRSELVVTFAKSSAPKGSQLKVLPTPAESAQTYQYYSKNPKLITFSGSRGWVAKGRILTLVRRNWRPSRDDDIRLYFGPFQRSAKR